MYKNRANGRNNLVGENVKRLRKNLKGTVSQKDFAEMLQRAGIDIDKNAVGRIETGKRFVIDIELKAIANLFNITCDELLENQ
ncbi:MAG: helix-turn-helix domain-containing protein [Turicibacter sp.]|nr:helix-turn-helix domain-containing protein [Turicibacter sp.]